MRPRPGGFSFCTGQHVALARFSGSAHDAVSRCGWNPDYPHSDEAGGATDRDRAASLAALEAHTEHLRFASRGGQRRTGSSPS
jgi:hypothetical protein